MSEPQIALIHGREVSYRLIQGSGAPVLLVHGIGASMESWADIPDRLASAGHAVLLVDLQGHGRSSLESGDYSLGAHANTLRDLLDVLGISRVHLVGHSLGGGVAMQFIYQFPERADHLVLVSSGGLGDSLNAGLRMATLPGSGLFVSAAFNRGTMAAASWVGRTLTRIGVRDHALTPETLSTVGKLAHPKRRAAFLSTLRGAITHKGQIATVMDKPHILGDRPILIVWGDRDPLIPVTQGEAAHDLLPNSRLVVFIGAGHEPHLYDPARFAQEVIAHISTLQPAR